MTHQVEPEIDGQKMQFILDYVITARANGRTKDLDGSFYRQEIINCAADLYERAAKASLK